MRKSVALTVCALLNFQTFKTIWSVYLLYACIVTIVGIKALSHPLPMDAQKKGEKKVRSYCQVWV